ncbi:endoribonuclease MazF [Xenorhabdus bovienii]|uniref:endoribonuclease MazF n=1 Tax=Xenorhabdus bovienii TaxID=40576 RepID=UPI0023B24C46|nr:endoribonuclease MazF [Xenorhabdus bovienii]MDE9455153.1 endoribonuclease MazF [Xenorhabdus bovienii]MDE9518867.1 endoribonuclease MazF [Xenorhabdus bovienii]MDE9550711.1 endoribonuclease MazF [Xenorhabdus bovienii]
MKSKYVPEAGDIVWLDFDPQAGHRPALVLSPAIYNGRIGLMLCCPMTTKIKGYPFEVKVEGEGDSAVLADQVKSLDWRERNATIKGKVSASVLSEVKAKAKALIG